MSEESVRIIKRYSNRKLYDTKASSYITLSEIGDLVRQGVEVKVVDHKSGEDLSHLTLAQILVEGEKQGRDNGFSTQTLRVLLEQGEEALSYLKGAVNNVVTEAEKSGKWLERTIQGTKNVPDEFKGVFREFLQNSQQSIGQWQGNIDQKLEHLMGRLSLVTQMKKEMTRVAGKLKQLDERLTRLEASGKKGSEK